MPEKASQQIQNQLECMYCHFNLSEFKYTENSFFKHLFGIYIIKL